MNKTLNTGLDYVVTVGKDLLTGYMEYAKYLGRKKLSFHVPEDPTDADVKRMLGCLPPAKDTHEELQELMQAVMAMYHER